MYKKFLDDPDSYGTKSFELNFLKEGQCGSYTVSVEQ